MTPPVALTIAGSDSAGGAGIQADLTTFAALGVHGCSVLTALTAQSTVGVHAVHVPPVSFLAAQLGAVLADLPVAAVKTGMLATAEVIELVARAAAGGDLPRLVVDPVVVSSTGHRLLEPGAERAYRQLLLPHTLVLTPNRHEAGVLLGGSVDDVASADDVRAAAAALADLGPRWVVVKGGHVPGTRAVDVVFDAATGTIHDLAAPWVDTQNDHGTGCTFAAGTAALLAAGAEPLEALHGAKRFVHRALATSASWRLGAGHGPVAHVSPSGAHRD